MIADVFATLFAGLGLFFIGVKFIGGHLRQVTGRRFRALVAHAVGHPLRAGLLGVLSGAVTQSTNAVTFIAISLVAAGAMPVRRAMPLVGWANVGTSALVMVATLDIHLMVLYLLGVVGFAYFLDAESSSRLRHAAGALLGVALLFLGLQFMKTGAAPLRELEAVRELMWLATDSWTLVFLLGVAFALVAQSSATVTVVAVAMTSVGLFSLDQTMVLIYGASLGSGLGVWFLTANLDGTARQLAWYQVFIKSVGVVAMLALFVAETSFGVPLVKALAMRLTPDVAMQCAWVYLIFQVVACGLVSLVQGPTARLMARLSPPAFEEELARPAFLYEQALDDAETALDLVEKEQHRIVAHLALALDTEAGRAGDTEGDRMVVAAAMREVTAEVDRFLADLMDRDNERGSLDRMINLQGRNGLIANLQESIGTFAATIEPVAGEQGAEGLCHGLAEALHVVLLCLDDAVASRDEADIDLLLALTSDRAETMERLRHRLLREGRDLPVRVHEALFKATSLFERIVWLMRRYALLLDGGRQAMAGEAPAGVEAA